MTMATLDLITKAESDKKASADAAGAMATATQAKIDADAAAATSASALCADLTANGPAAIVDNSTNPPVVTLYTAATGDTYTSTVLRVAT
jgi:hypothetical protein